MERVTAKPRGDYQVRVETIMTKELIIKGNNIEKIYGQGRNALKVLKDISFEIARGDIASIIGPSGAGKSTLLNLVGCLDSFNSGRLKLLGKDVSHLTVEDLSGFRNRHIGFVFQQHNLLPEFTALENIMIPLLIRRTRRKKARERALEMLENFNLTERGHHYPSELSGGECQRIAVARAIIGDPDILLADEPTGSLDSANSDNLVNIMLDLGRKKNTTIIIITHDLKIASRTEKTISLIDGKIVGGN